eukprot:gene11289-23623_t
MKFGNYDILLLDNSRNISFPERTVAGKEYVVADPGREYSVNVIVRRDKESKLFPTRLLKIGLYVDGQDVNYWKRLALTNPDEQSAATIFWGFKTNSTDIRSFVFASPSVTTNATIDPNASKLPLGQIEVVLFEAIESEGIFQNKIQNNENNNIPSLNSDKKFWQLPSVTTSAGDRVNHTKEKFIPLPAWSNKSHFPFARFTVLYHTSAMLNLMGKFMQEEDLSAGVLSSLGKRALETTSLSSDKRLNNTDSNTNNNHTSSSNNNNKSSNDIHNNNNSSHNILNNGIEYFDSEVRFIPAVPKIVPYIDLSDDNTRAVWTTITKQDE